MGGISPMNKLELQMRLSVEIKGKLMIETEKPLFDVPGVALWR
jgi:hypothetical protein